MNYNLNIIKILYKFRTIDQEVKGFGNTKQSERNAYLFSEYFTAISKNMGTG